MFEAQLQELISSNIEQHKMIDVISKMILAKNNGYKLTKEEEKLFAKLISEFIKAV